MSRWINKFKGGLLKGTIYQFMNRVPFTPTAIQRVRKVERMHQRMTTDLQPLTYSIQNQSIFCGPVRGKILHRKSSDVQDNSTEPFNGDAIVLYVHGGAFIVGTPEGYAPITYRLAHGLPGFRVIAIDYRKSPIHSFPAGLDDVVSSYLHLVDKLGVDAKKIILMGDSAGGNLIFSLCLYCIQHSIPLPAGLVGFSPWLDLSVDKAELVARENAVSDPMLPMSRSEDVVDLYLNGFDPKPRSWFEELEHTIHNEPLKAITPSVTHPLVSPVHASPSELSKFPPFEIHLGTRDTLIYDSQRFMGAIRDSKGKNQGSLIVYEDMPHVFQFMPWLYPEGIQSLKGACDFAVRVTQK